MADIKTPLGNMPKPVLYIALVAGGGALIYSYVKKKNAKSTATNAATGAVAGAYGYGSQYGYGTGAAPYGYGAYTYAPYGYGFGSSGLGGYGGASGYGYGFYNAGVGTPVPQQATTNAQWSQAALSALTNQNMGYTGQQVLAALGPYLQGKPLTQDQVGVVQAAIAVEGYPPTDGPNGQPPGINTGGTTGGGGTGQGSNITVPNVVGESQVDAFRTLSDMGLKATGTKTVPGKILTVQSQNPPAGASVTKGTSVKLTSKVVK